ncbi:hypothetical protein IFU39_16570 [Paenibacillus sp. CFBP 13594]|uniref:hypothetical protein n=1 Tax=Paenibacillus sp. CFBP 13594 TaxID=2774037 RepID=UPI00177D84C7|nr:hypothetical protein [Paenibacillus sp. CFBP 13594]MBD8839428.1 hypothetical protein [Paenibacillus sp. CFBP 13594]
MESIQGQLSSQEVDFHTCLTAGKMYRKKENGDRDWLNSVPTDGFHRDFNKETGLWTFQCSLKNYESTIEYFLENVLSKVVETIIHLEYYYEEWDQSIMFEFIEGQISKSTKEGIKYNAYL